MTRMVCRWMVVFALCVGAALLHPAEARADQKFDTLTIGPTTYRNVTVTTKSKTYIMLMHAEGMASIPLSEVPPDVRRQLGYEVAGLPTNSAPVTATAATAAPAKVTPAPATATPTPAPTPAKADLAVRAKEAPAQATGQVSAPEKEKTESTLAITQFKPGSIPRLDISNAILIGVLVGLLVFHLFFSYCCSLICIKAGEEPGILIWIPFFQWIPMFKAAGMSPLWILAYFVPVLSIVAGIMWCFKIAEARGKSMIWGILLILPITDIFAFLYLAFSDSGDTFDSDVARPAAA